MWMRLPSRVTQRESNAVELPSILATVSGAEPPRLAADGRTIVIDASTVADDVYLRYASLLRRSEFRITRGGVTTVHAVEAAVYDEETRELRLSVVIGGPWLGALETASALELRPRVTSDFARVLDETLPRSLRAKIEFQTAPDAASGVPDLSGASPWADEISPTAQHLRFRISLALREVRAAPVSSTPVPSLDFLRVRLGF